MRTSLLLLLFIIPAARPLAAGEAYISDLPAGKIKADVMQPAMTPRAAELTAKLRAAIQRDREGWQSDVQKGESGERLAWDERLGLTRAEHDELQRLSGETKLAKAAEAEIEFIRSSDGRVMLSSSLPELSGIVIDTENDFVDTPFGRITEQSDVIAGDDQRAGQWNGVQWKLEAPGATPGAGKNVRFAIGRLILDGRGILFYEAKDIEPGKVPRRANYVLVFPLP